MGEPTISNPDAPNPVQHVIPHAKEMKISIAADGQSSMLAAGHASGFTAKVLEETPLYIKVGVSGQSNDEAFVYDKSTRLLMMPMNLEIEDSKGILPVYFKRSR